MAPLIYVINLEALGLPFERLPAVMAKDVPEW